MNPISQGGPISQGFTAPTSQSARANDPKDIVTLNLKPEQITDKSIQAFVRQMAKEGTPVKLNFVDANAGNQSAQVATEASSSADRIKNTGTVAAPPTYSERVDDLQQFAIRTSISATRFF